MRKIYVRLDHHQSEVLTLYAEAQHRHPSDQAAILLAPAIDRIAKKITPKSKELSAT